MRNAGTEDGAVHALDGRLFAIASLVRQGVRLADVGCDHGQLICALAADGLISGGIACDINAKPLQKAADAATRMQVSERVACRLGDGLRTVSEAEVDDIVIAGMGGELIAEIIEGCPWGKNQEKRWILQPMTRAPYLRRWLCAQGYTIETEHGCAAMGRTYAVLRARYKGERRTLSELDPYGYVGELSANPGVEAGRYIRAAAASLQKRADGIRPADAARATALTSLARQLVEITKGW